MGGSVLGHGTNRRIVGDEGRPRRGGRGVRQTVDGLIAKMLVGQRDLDDHERALPGMRPRELQEPLQ